MNMCSRRNKQTTNLSQKNIGRIIRVKELVDATSPH